MVDRAVVATHPDVEVGIRWLDAEEMRAWVGLIELSARLVTLGDGELCHRYGITGRDYELLHHPPGQSPASCPPGRVAPCWSDRRPTREIGCYKR